MPFVKDEVAARLYESLVFGVESGGSRTPPLPRRAPGKDQTAILLLTPHPQPPILLLSYLHRTNSFFLSPAQREANHSFTFRAASHLVASVKVDPGSELNRGDLHLGGSAAVLPAAHSDRKLEAQERKCKCVIFTKKENSIKLLNLNN